MYFGVDRDVIYLLRDVLAYHCGTQLFQVSIVLFL